MLRSTAIALCVMLLAGIAQAQVPAPPRMAVDIMDRVGVDQNLGAQIPLDLVFTDDTGREVTLAEYFGDKPVLLSLVYYRCPSLCTMTLNGMVRSFRPLNFSIGEEFTVLTVSFDPTEGPELAAQKKALYVEQYGREGAADGWHFLTGRQESIDRLCQTVGFRYMFDTQRNEYAHGAAIMVITPDGRVSRYFYGLEYSTRDLRLGLVEASTSNIGSFADAVQLLCYQYDPMTGTYGFRIMWSLRIGATVTILALGGFIFTMVRREKRNRRLEQAGAPAGAPQAD